MNRATEWRLEQEFKIKACNKKGNSNFSPGLLNSYKILHFVNVICNIIKLASFFFFILEAVPEDSRVVA